jgi:hypothetical protein
VCLFAPPLTELVMVGQDAVLLVLGHETRCGLDPSWFGATTAGRGGTRIRRRHMCAGGLEGV